MSAKDPLTIHDGFRIGAGMFIFNVLAGVIVGAAWVLWHEVHPFATVAFLALTAYGIRKFMKYQ